MKRLLCLSMAILISACATKHPGNLGKATLSPAKLPLKLSAQNIDGEKDAGLQVVEVTLENTSSDWLRLDKTTLVENPSENGKVSVVLGNDLKAWAEASEYKKKLEFQNKDAVYGTGTLAGSTAAQIGIHSGNNEAAIAGLVIAVGTLAWVIADAIALSVSQAQQSQKIPENHLYRPATIAPKMFVRRWILLNKPEGKKVKSLTLEFETVEGEKESYVVAI